MGLPATDELDGGGEGDGRRRAGLRLEGVWSALLVPASRLEVEPRRRRLATGIAALDAQLGGGWPAAAVSELAGSRSSGRTSVLHATLAAALAGDDGAGGRDSGAGVALVDAADAFDARAAAAAGVPLPRLLWVRAAGRSALTATDLLVAAGGFRLVAIDLGERPPRSPDAAWLRLRHAAERQGTVVLVTAPHRVVGAVASAAVVLRSAGPRFVAAGGPLLVALETRAAIERSVGAAPAAANQQPPLRFTARR